MLKQGSGGGLVHNLLLHHQLGVGGVGYGRPSCKLPPPPKTSFCLLSKSLCSLQSSSSMASSPLPPPPPPTLPSSSSSPDVDTVLSYHSETKHHLQRYARGPHGLDWANQPNPFLRYLAPSSLLLDHPAFAPPSPDPPYPLLFSLPPPPSPLSKPSLSHLLYHSLALSAWKSTPYSTWSLRVNPSSGNLHPTEGYVLSGPLPGLVDSPFVAHYAPKEHVLEIRAEIPLDLWRDLADGLPQGSILVGLTSIFWREAWKYGERAFRYCNHDVGHAIGAVSIAAATLGWDTALLDGWGNHELEQIFGLRSLRDVPTSGRAKGYFPELEREHADCLMAVFPRTGQERKDFVTPSQSLVASIASRMAQVAWKGEPNALSKEHVRWGIIYKAAAASRKLTTSETVTAVSLPNSVGLPQVYEPVTARQVVRKRRSAVDMDGRHSMERDAFYQILLKALPSEISSDKQGVQQQLPFRALPWRAELHMALFVHRVVGLSSGLYFLVRNSDQESALRRAMRPEFEWIKPEGSPEGLPLYRLAAGDCRQLAMRVSCHQEIAGDGCFSLGMIAHFEPTIKEKGAWMYPRLFWESGVLGQLLYLEAHAMGISATGIGCYFDDAVHEILGFTGKEFQSLYHFTIGAPVLDKRIMSLPAYPGPAPDS